MVESGLCGHSIDHVFAVAQAAVASPRCETGQRLVTALPSVEDEEARHDGALDNQIGEKAPPMSATSPPPCGG